MCVSMIDCLVWKKWKWDLGIYIYWPLCLGNNFSVNFVNWIFLFSWHTELRLLLLEIACLKGESSFFVQMQMRNKNRLKDHENNFYPLERNENLLFPSKSWCIFIPLSCSLWEKIVVICILTFVPFNDTTA